MNSSDVLNQVGHIEKISPGLKTGISVAAGSFCTGFGTLISYSMKWLEGNSLAFASLASLAAFVLSMVLIFVHLRRLAIDEKRLSMEEKKNKNQ